MSISSMMSTALTGIMTSQAALRTVSNNIANVNTDGYVRQVARQETVVTGVTSGGVTLASVDRIVDRFLQQASYTAQSDVSSADIKGRFHDRLQGFLGRPDSNSTLSARMDQIYASFSALATSPGDFIQRQATVSAIEDFTVEVDRLSGAVQDLRNDANLRIYEVVSDVNSSLSRIYQLNKDIVRQKALGSDVGDMESLRDGILRELSQKIDVRAQVKDDGAMVITSASGNVLVDLSLRHLEYKGPGVVTSGTIFPPVTITRVDLETGEKIGNTANYEGDISSGELRGLIELRDDDLRDLSLSLGELSASFTETFNQVHNTYSAVPAPNSLTGEPTAIAGGHTPGFTGIVNFSVVDANNNLVSKATVDFDAAAPADMTALMANVNGSLGGAGTLSLVNGTLSFTAAAGGNGVVITDDLAAPSDRGGRSFSHYFGMNNLLKADVPSSFKTGFVGTDAHNMVAATTTAFDFRDKDSNLLASYAMVPVGSTFNDLISDLNTSPLGTYGSFALNGGGELAFTPVAGLEAGKLSVVNDSSNMAGSGITFSRLFGVGDRYTAGASTDIHVVERIADDPGQLALGLMDLTATVGKQALGKSDQAGANAMSNLNNALVQFDGAGDLPDLNVSLGRYAAAFLGNAGLMGARAGTKLEDTTALYTEIEMRRSEVSGVNIDEELANMVVLQNAFSASARIIATAQEMFRDVLAIL
ncbi:MAG: flagellar hook-associated protein FlgK [Sphingomonadales bacterium]|nr:flagellar hook-associated protein FlgK [Sphingomonadales bacterium]